MTDQQEKVEAAIASISKYLHQLSISRGLDKEEIAGMHVGDEREAVLKSSDLRTLLSAYQAQAGENERLVREWEGRERADARFRADWKKDDLLKRLDYLRRQLAGMRPGDVEDIAELQSRCLSAEARATTAEAKCAGLVEAVKLAVDLVERDVIRVRPSEREELISALTLWNAAILSAKGV